MATPIKQIIFAQKAAPAGATEQIMDDPSSVGAGGGMFTVDSGNVLNLTDLFVVTERLMPGATRFRIRLVTGNIITTLTTMPIMFMVSITGPTSTEYSLDESRPLTPGTYVITVEEPANAAANAFAALQLVGVGNARS